LAVVPLASARANLETKAAATTVHVSGGEFFFKLTTKTLAKPGPVTFVFKNVGHVAHDFRINGKQTPLISPGKTAKITVSFKKPGKYTYLCTVPGHAEAGDEGDVHRALTREGPLTPQAAGPRGSPARGGARVSCRRSDTRSARPCRGR
jgi:uncharacterized cupredoxin-like copper-binding protein